MQAYQLPAERILVAAGSSRPCQYGPKEPPSGRPAHHSESRVGLARIVDTYHLQIHVCKFFHGDFPAIIAVYNVCTRTVRTRVVQFVFLKAEVRKSSIKF